MQILVTTSTTPSSTGYLHLRYVPSQHLGLAVVGICGEQFLLLKVTSGCRPLREMLAKRPCPVPFAVWDTVANMAALLHDRGDSVGNTYNRNTIGYTTAHFDTSIRLNPNRTLWWQA